MTIGYRKGASTDYRNVSDTRCSACASMMIVCEPCNESSLCHQSDCIQLFEGLFVKGCEIEGVCY